MDKSALDLIVIQSGDVLSDAPQPVEADKESPTENTTAFGAGVGTQAVITGDWADNDLGSHSSTTSNTIHGDLGNDTLRGGTGNDKLYGDGDNDLLIGWQGSDTLDGGDGYDTVSYETETGGAGVVVNLTASSWTYGGRTYASMTGKDTWGSIDSYAQIEAVAGSQGNDIINASDTPDQFVLYGGAGSDTLMGGGSDPWGLDLLVGGEGDDVLIGGIAYFEGAAAVTVDLRTGIATGQGTDTLQSISYVIGSDGNDLIRAADISATLDGGAGNDTLYGGAGNDDLYTGSGTNVVYGSAGSDGITVDGMTTLRYDQFVWLDALGNNIAGFVSADLEMGYVHKYKNNPSGTVTNFDRLGEDNITPGVVYDFVATGGSDYVRGDTLDNRLTGLAGNDSIWGAAGNDVLDGGDGNDTLDGGIGNDLLDGGLNNDLLKGGDGHDNLLAGSGRDTLEGGNGDDTLDGGIGADSMVGGSGNDAYYVDDLDDSMTELAGGGTDTVYVSVRGYDHLKLTNIENVVLVGEGSIDYSNVAPEILGASSPIRVTVADTGIATPFSNLTVTDNGAWVKVTVKMNQLPGYAIGSFTSLGPGIYDRIAGAYTVSGDIATVQAALRALQFDPSENPSGAVGSIRTETFTITVVDDRGITSAPNSNISVDVVAQNRTPVLIAPSAAYTVVDTENVNPVSPFVNVAINDTNLSDVLTVTIRLDSPTKGSLVFTKGTYDAATGVYTFTGSASDVQSAVRALKFNATDRTGAEPGSIETTIFTINVTDAGGLSSGPFSTIRVNSVHGTLPAGIAPAISGSETITYEDRGPINPFRNFSLSDDSASITATIAMDSPSGGEFLNLGIGSYDSANGTYTVTGTVADVQAAIRALKYDANLPAYSQVGSTFTRKFAITVTDDSFTSTNTSFTLNAMVANQAPTLIAQARTVTIADNENDDLARPFSEVVIDDVNLNDSVTVRVTLDDPAKGVLVPGNGGTYANGLYTFTGTVAAVQAALRALQYNPRDRDGEPGIETTTFSIQVIDARGLSSGVNTSIKVDSVHGTLPGAAPVIGGADAPVTVTIADIDVVMPFTSVTITDDDPTVTVTIAMDAPWEGEFTNLGIGTYNRSAGAYMVSGTAAQVQTAIQNLRFIPQERPNAQVGSIQTTTFTITASDGTHAATNTNISVDATAANRTPTLNAPVRNVTIADDEDTNLATPFTSVTIGDMNANDTVTVTITLDAAGQGVLVPVNGGVYDPQTGVFTFTGSAAAAQAAVQALQYNPTNRPDAENGSVETSHFTIMVTDAGGLSTAPNTNISVDSVHTVNQAPVIGGADAPVTVTIADTEVASPFSSVTITDDSPAVTVTIAMDAASEGEFTNLGIGVYDRNAGTYTVTGTAAQVEAAIQALQFIPEARTAPAGSVQTTNFTMSVVDSQGIAGQPNSNISVASTASNLAPTAPQLTGGSISDMAGAGSQVGTLSASDQNGDVLTYTFSEALAGSNGLISADGRFEIANNAVVVRDPTLIQVAQDSTFTYSVVASDGHGGHTSGGISIVVADINKAPTNLQLSNSLVQENLAEGQIVGLVSASDPNGTALSYTLLDDAGGSVELVGNELRVADSTRFDYEQGPLTITVAVSDGSAIVTETFTIGLEDLRRENVVGNAGNNVIRGGVGSDTLNGAAGNDTLHGGEGRDQLIGGSGADTFVFDTAVMKTTADSILDFSIAEGDRIYLSHKIFSGLGLGQLSANAFALGTEAQDQDDRIIYDQANGRLFYDLDGTGGATRDIRPVLFATLNENGGKPALTHASFYLI